MFFKNVPISFKTSMGKLPKWNILIMSKHFILTFILYCHLIYSKSKKDEATFPTLSEQQISTLSKCNASGQLKQSFLEHCALQENLRFWLLFPFRNEDTFKVWILYAKKFHLEDSSNVVFTFWSCNVLFLNRMNCWTAPDSRWWGCIRPKGWNLVFY